MKGDKVGCRELVRCESQRGSWLMTSVNSASREVGQPRGLAQAAEGCVWVGTHVGTVLIRVYGTGPLGQTGMLLYRSTNSPAIYITSVLSVQLVAFNSLTPIIIVL